ncbi:MAG: hypothetical protein AAF986_03420 [Pseudomonadota bacterium]
MADTQKPSETELSHDAKELMPFIIYHNSLDMVARLIKSSCDLSLAILDSTKQSQTRVAQALSNETPAQAFADGMIPTTDEMDHAAQVVASAMNDAAGRALASVNAAPSPALNLASEQALDASPSTPKVSAKTVGEPSKPRLPRSITKKQSPSSRSGSSVTKSA